MTWTMSLTICIKFSLFSNRPLQFDPPEEIAAACIETRTARRAKMEEAMENSTCTLTAWVPDAQDIEDEQEIVLSR